jgi:hypothetical protein
MKDAAVSLDQHFAACRPKDRMMTLITTDHAANDRVTVPGGIRSVGGVL